MPDPSLPKRFWLEHELEEGEFIPFYLRHNVKAADFIKEYRKIFGAHLKSQGFKILDGRAFKQSADGELTYMLSFATDKYGQRGYFVAAVQPNALPTRGGFFNWDAQKPQSYQTLFMRSLTLPNGNKEFDLGRSYVEGEVAETIAYVQAAYEAQAPAFWQHFAAYPEPFLSFQPDDLNYLDARNPLAEFDFRSDYIYPVFDVAYFLAHLHAHLGNKAQARAFAQFMLDHNERFASLNPIFPHPHTRERGQKLLLQFS